MHSITQQKQNEYSGNYTLRNTDDAYLSSETVVFKSIYLSLASTSDCLLLLVNCKKTDHIKRIISVLQGSRTSLLRRNQRTTPRQGKHIYDIS